MSDRSDSAERLAAACAAIATGLAAGLPPEVFPETGPLLALLLLAGHLLASRPVRSSPVIGGYLLGLLALATTFAPGLYAETVTRFLLIAAAFSLCWRLGSRALGPVAATLGTVGVALGLLAVAQKAVLIDLQLALARRWELPEAVAVRLAQGRPYGTHVVPAALGGVLVLVLCALLALATRERPRDRGPRALIGLGALPVLAGLVLTASAGALAGLAAALVVPLVSLRRSGSRRLVTAVLLAAVLLGAAGISMRRDAASGVLRSLEERAGNWRGAIAMIAREPVTGVGPGAYRSIWPQLRRPGEVETAYAHDSWLQLVAEGGLPWLLLIVSGLVALVRRAREGARGHEPWLVAGIVAFAVQNLADFTLYLPGVAVPAAALAGLAFARDRAGEDRPVRPRRLAVWALCAALGAGAVVLAGEALSRRALERGERALSEGNTAAALAAAGNAARAGRLDARRLVDAARLVVRAAPAGRPGALDPASGWLRSACRLDPESPAPWHALADLELRAGRPTASWRAYALARSRHPADPRLAGELNELEGALAAAGLFSVPLNYGGQPERPLEAPWTTWDDLLLIAGLALALVVLIRTASIGPAPPMAVALGLLLLFSFLGEGGALPGARLARQAILAAGLGAAATGASLGPLRNAVGRSSGTRAIALLFAAAAGWAALAALLAPYPAAARDGFGAMAGACAAGAMSYALAARHAAWRRLVLTLGAGGASAMGLLWLAQRALLAFGADLASWPAPLHVAAGRDPAADFLHPGHLGTVLLATGAGLGVTALLEARRRPARLAWGAALVIVGLSGLARASLLALGGAALAAVSLPLPRRARRALAAGLAVAAIVGIALLGWRFAVREDPYAWSRARIWASCAGAVADRPVLGFGPGGFASRAAAYAIEDPTAVARWGKVFSGPHSDLLGALLALGLPGGLALLAGLALAGRRAWRETRRALHDEPERAGLVVLLAALAAHALVDDLLGGRPAVGLLFAVALGSALAGAGTPGHAGPAARWPEGRPLRVAFVVALIVALAGLEFRPWLADRVRRSGDAELAANIDPARAASWIAAARRADGPPARRLATALDRTTRARLAFDEGAAAWREHGRVLEAACRGPLAQREVCAAARAAFARAVALEPHDVFSMRHAGRLSVLVGEPDAAERWFDRALTDEPDFLGAWLDTARLALDRGDLPGALAALEELQERARRLATITPQTPRDASLMRLEKWEQRDLERLVARAGASRGTRP